MARFMALIGNRMDTIYAEYSVSMSEFKRNPAQVLRAAGEKPVAVLNHNRPAFYMVTPRLFEALVEEMADRNLMNLVRQRLAHKDSAVEVDIDRI
jgi:antitoxin StbD